MAGGMPFLFSLVACCLCTWKHIYAHNHTLVLAVNAASVLILLCLVHMYQLSCSCDLQNVADGNGLAASPKPGDISYIRDPYFKTIYDRASNAMTASAPTSALRGKNLELEWCSIF